MAKTTTKTVTTKTKKKMYSKKPMKADDRRILLDDVLEKSLKKEDSKVRELADKVAEKINADFRKTFNISEKTFNLLLEQGYLKTNSGIKVYDDNKYITAVTSNVYVDCNWSGLDVKNNKQLLAAYKKLNEKRKSIKKTLEPLIEVFKSPARIIENIPELECFFGEVHKPSNIIPFKVIEDARKLVKGLTI